MLYGLLNQLIVRDTSCAATYQKDFKSKVELQLVGQLMPIHEHLSAAELLITDFRTKVQRICPVAV